MLIPAPLASTRRGLSSPAPHRWHGARVESRANFPLDPAAAVLHYAQEIFEGLKAYKRDDGGVNCSAPTPMPSAFYLIEPNAAQAALRAGYSAKTARVIGPEKNLSKPVVAAAIEKARAKRAGRAEVTADWVVDELRKLASSNMADYMKSTPAGPALDFASLTRDQAGALSEVSVEYYDAPAGKKKPSAIKRVKFKLYDKSAALVHLGRHLGLFDMKRQPDAPVEVDIDEMRETVLRALARLADARAAEGGDPLAGPRTIEGVATRLDEVGPAARSAARVRA